MLTQFARSVDTRLGTVLDGLHARWTVVAPELDEPIAALRDSVLRGGKRLRPGFVVLGVAAAGGDPERADAVDVGAAIELLHAFALLHDDVMDGSDTRRGQPAVHRRASERGRQIRQAVLAQIR